VAAPTSAATSPAARLIQAVTDGTHYVNFRAIPIGKGGGQGLSQCVSAGNINLIERMVADHVGDGLDVFFGVAERGTAAKGGAANCTRLFALFADVDFKDTPEATAREKLAAFSLPPSITVHSGNGLHCYWLLSQPINLAGDGASRAKALLRNLAHAVGGDLKAAEPARILRLPGTKNFKYSPPRSVVIESESDTRYTVQDFSAAFPSDAAAAAPEFLGDVAEGDRNTTLFREGCRLRERGWQRDEILEALRALNHEGRVRPVLPEPEISQIADSACRYAPGETRQRRTGAERTAEFVEIERARRAARRVVDAEERNDTQAFAFHGEASLLAEQPAPELIEGLLVEGSLFMLFGPKNLGKTFLTIALGYAVARPALDFLGMRVRRHGDVILVLAEGGSRIGLRLLAFREANHIGEATDRMHIVKGPVHLTDAVAVDSFIAAIKVWSPKLVIFDTLARCMPGAVENAAEDMSLVVANLDRIRQQLPGCTVGVIHHPTKSNDDVERGAGTFANATDTVLNVREHEGVFQLTTKYSRDLQPGAPIPYSLDPIVLEGTADQHGIPFTSAVVRRLDEDEVERAKDDAERLDNQILSHLHEQGPQSGAALAERLKCRKEAVLQACRRLAEGRRVKQTGKGKNVRWEIARQLRLVTPEDLGQ